MSEANDAAVLKALNDVSVAVTSMRADIDALKKPKGRTAHDVIDRDRIERKNAAVGAAQDILDRARHVRRNHASVLERIRAAREERPASRLVRGMRRDVAASALGHRGVGIDHLTGNPLSAEQVAARAGYRPAFLAFAKSGDDREIRRIAPKAAMQTQIGDKGGFLVPVEMEKQVISLSMLASMMRSLADVRPITVGNSLKQPVNLQGSTFGWTGEVATRVETGTDDVGIMQWYAMEAYAQPKVTNLLLQDAEMDVEAWLLDGISREFSEGEALGFISGSGSNQPRGILAYSTVANASWAWGSVGYIASGIAAALTDASNNGFDKLIDVTVALNRSYLPNATWLSNRLTQSVLRKVKDTTGQYIWQQSTVADQPSMLLGYPSETDDQMPNIGAGAFPIAFADFKQAYRIVDKPGMVMLRDEVTSKGSTIFYTTKRVGGGIKNFEAIKLVKIAVS